MKLRRINPIITFITILTFMVCFGASFWYSNALSYKYNSFDSSFMLRSVSSTGTASVNYRRNTETQNPQLAIAIANYFINTANNDNPFFEYVTFEIMQSSWLLYGKLSIPARADPNLLIA